jgi:phage virion morphogenesis protein
VTDDLTEIGRVASDLLLSTGPVERRRILRSIARDLRQSQAARVLRQENPDGSPFAARKPRASRFRRQGQIRTKVMFRKLVMAKHLRTGVSADEAWVGFVGRAARVARPHQEGSIDRAAPGAPPVRYARRVLLGLTDAERQRMFDAVLAAVTASVR